MQNSHQPLTYRDRTDRHRDIRVTYLNLSARAFMTIKVLSFCQDRMLGKIDSAGVRSQMAEINSNTTHARENKPNLEELMQLGVQTAQAGNKRNARMIFQQVLEQDNENERAWLWMAAVAETPIDRLRCLNTVLRINPNNKTALDQLEKMKKRQESSNTAVIRYGFIGLSVLILLVALAIIVLIAV